MRDRMIELCKQATTAYLNYLDSLDQKGLIDTEGRAKFIADYLLANGIIVLPCKIGTRVYRLIPDLSVTWPDPSEYKIIWDTFKLDDIYTFGKTVFLTREEAEKALAEKNKNN